MMLRTWKYQNSNTWFFLPAVCFNGRSTFWPKEGGKKECKWAVGFVIGRRCFLIFRPYNATPDGTEVRRSAQGMVEKIPDDWLCVGCGETFGEWSHIITENCLASDHDSRSERLGEMECNYCGAQEWVPPDNAPALADSGEKRVVETKVKVTDEQMEEALQDAWNDWCVDTGFIPSCFSIKGPSTTRVVADFEGSAFAESVAKRLNHILNAAALADSGEERIVETQKKD